MLRSCVRHVGIEDNFGTAVSEQPADQHTQDLSSHTTVLTIGFTDFNTDFCNAVKDETQIPLDRNFKAFDDLGNKRIELNMCWIPLEDVPNMSIYPPQAKEYIVNLPDEIIIVGFEKYICHNISSPCSAS